MLSRILVFLSVSVLVAGCASAPHASSFIPGASPQTMSAQTSPIRHLIIVVQENRSFDNLFATYPGADGTTKGKTPHGLIRLHAAPLVGVLGADNDHSYQGFETQYDHGKMDGWPREPSDRQRFDPYEYVDPAQIAPYWEIARKYTLADHFFPTERSASFPAHQDILSGNALVGKDSTWIDIPSSTPWGCDAPAGTTTSLLFSDGHTENWTGPRPCHDRKTLATLLDAAGLSWKYYVPSTGTGNIWNGFRVIPSVFYGPEWKTNIVSPSYSILNDIKRGHLANVSWVVPNTWDSDHPGESTTDIGPEWIAAIVNTVGRSSYWKSTAIVVLWDDWGGEYDHVPPPQLDWKGLGIRVPLLIVSAYSKPGYISHTQYEFGSILKFAEETFGLPSLYSTDARATSISDSFDFTKATRFRPIKAKPFVPQPVDGIVLRTPDGD